MLKSLRRKNYFNVNIISERLWLFDGTVVTNMYYGGVHVSALRYWRKQI
jgi:hypothetical protein